MALTQQQRDDLKVELKAIDAAGAPVMKLMEPLRDAIAGLEDVRSITLLRYGLTDEPSDCEGCQAFIVPGDRYQPTEDAGPLCEACAYTYAEIKEQVEERLKEASGRDAEDNDRNRQFLKNYDTHIAAGGKPEDKVLYEFEL